MHLSEFLQIVKDYIYALILAGWYRALQSVIDLLGLHMQPDDLEVSFLCLDIRVSAEASCHWSKSE